MTYPFSSKLVGPTCSNPEVFESIPEITVSVVFIGKPGSWPRASYSPSFYPFLLAFILNLVKASGLAILFGFNVELNQAIFSADFFFTILKSNNTHYDQVDRTKTNEFQMESNDICNCTSIALQEHVQQEGNEETAKL